MLVHQPRKHPRLDEIPPKPPVWSLELVDQFKYHERVEARNRRTTFISFLIIIFCLAAIFIQPFSSATKWGWRTAQLPTTDALHTSIQTDYKASEEFTKPLKVGDKILGFEVTSAYGQRVAPTQGASTKHEGVDLATPVGTPLYVIGKPKSGSAFGGIADVFCTVPSAEDARGQAAFIKTVDFPDIEFVYYHLNVCSGGRLEPGMKFGETGNTGNSTAPHLHFGVRIKGDWLKADFKEEYIEPMTGFVRWTLEGKEPQKASNKPIVERLRNAIAGQESNHDSKAVNPHSNALGYGQVMPENIKEWSTQCLGAPITENEFIKSKDKQIKIIDCKLSQYLTEFRNDPFDIQVKKVGAKWYAGDGSLYQNTKPQKYGAGDYPSISDYSNNVWERFEKQ